MDRFAAAALMAATVVNADLDYSYTQGFFSVDLPVPALFPNAGEAPFTLDVPLPAGLAFDAATGAITGSPDVAGTSTVVVTDNSQPQQTATLSLTVCPDVNGIPAGGLNCGCVAEVDTDKLDTELFEPTIDPVSRLGFNAAGEPILDAIVNMSVFEYAPTFSLGNTEMCAPTRTTMTYNADTCGYKWNLEIPYGQDLGSNVCEFDITTLTDQPQNPLQVEGDLRVSATVLGSTEDFRGNPVTVFMSRPLPFVLYAPTIIDTDLCDILQVGQRYCDPTDDVVCNGHGTCLNVDNGAGDAANTFGECQCDQGWEGNTCEHDNEPPTVDVTPVTAEVSDEFGYCCPFTGEATVYQLNACFDIAVADNEVDFNGLTVDNGRVSGVGCADSDPACFNGESHEAIDLSLFTGFESPVLNNKTTITISATDQATPNPLTTTTSFTFALCDTEDPVVRCQADVLTNLPVGQLAGSNLFPSPTKAAYGACDDDLAAPCYSDNDNVKTSVVTTTFNGVSAPFNTNDFTQDGEYTVCHEVTDDFLQQASCCFTVVIDRTPPAFTCPVDMSDFTDAGVSTKSLIIPGLLADDQTYKQDGLTLVVSSASDFSGAVAVNAGDTMPFDLNDVGSQTFYFKYTAVDQAGNSAECTFTMTVEDNEAPTFPTCEADMQFIDLAFDASTTDLTALAASLVSSQDNVGVATTVKTLQSPGSTAFQTATWTSKGIGVYTYKTVVTDYAGNSAECINQITVRDVTPPVVQCPAAAVMNTGDGVGQDGLDYARYTPTLSSTDNVEVTEVKIFDITDPVNPVEVTGTIDVACCTLRTYEYRVTDSSGNTETCEFTAKVNDDEAPTLVCPLENAAGETCPIVWNDSTTGMQVAHFKATVDKFGQTNLNGDFLQGFSPSFQFDLQSADNTNGVLKISKTQTTYAAASDFVQWQLTEYTNDPTTLDVYTLTYWIIDQYDNAVECGTQVENVDVVAPIPVCPSGTGLSIVTDDDSLVGTVSFTVNAADNGPLGATEAAGTASDLVCTYGSTILPYYEISLTEAPASHTTGPYGQDQFFFDRNLVQRYTTTFLPGVNTVTCTVADRLGLTGTCEFDVTVTKKCGDLYVNDAEECDGLEGCTAECVCDASEGYSPTDGGVTRNCERNTCANDGAWALNGGFSLASNSAKVVLDTDKYCADLRDVDYVPLNDCSDQEVGFAMEMSLTDKVTGDIVPLYSAFAVDEYVNVEWCPTTNGDDNVFSLLYKQGDNWLDTEAQCRFVNGNEFVGRAYDPNTDCYTFTVCGAFPLLSTGTTEADCEASIVCDEEEVLLSGTTEQTFSGLVLTDLYENVVGHSPSSVTVSPALDTPIAPGQTVTFTITATENGQETTCAKVVRVADDHAPYMTCDPAQVTCYTSEGLAYDSMCTGWETTAAEFTEDAVLVNNPVTTTGVPAQFDIGTYTITHTSVDEAGNTVTCDVDVTVEDNEPPKATCPTSTEWSVDAQSPFASLKVDEALLGLSGTDNSGVFSCEITRIDSSSLGVNSFQFGADTVARNYGVGLHTAEYKCTDAAGNIDVCLHTFEVVDDEAPYCGALTNACTFNVNDYTLEVTEAELLACFDTSGDYQAGDALEYIFSSFDGVTTAENGLKFVAPFDFTGPGFTIDAHLNDGPNNQMCHMRLNIVDTGSPVVECPADMTAEYDAVKDAQSGLLETLLAAAGVADNSYTTDATFAAQDSQFTTVASSLTFSDTFNINTVYTVEFTVQDVAGNEGTCTFDVTVVDSNPPVWDCPTETFTVHSSDLLDAQLSSTGVASDVVVTADIVGASISDNYPHVSATIDVTTVNLVLGAQTITYTATDAAGNTATCDVVIVLDDDQPPTGEDPDLECGGSITIDLTADQATAELPYDFVVTDDLTTIDHFDVITIVTDNRPVYLESETGWTYTEDSPCFSEFGYSRWGWRNNFDYDGSELVVTMPIYLGAAACDLNKGVIGGYATVTFPASSVDSNGNFNVVPTVELDISPGFALLENQMEFKNTPFTNIQPGSFPYKVSNDPPTSGIVYPETVTCSATEGCTIYSMIHTTEAAIKPYATDAALTGTITGLTPNVYHVIDFVMNDDEGNESVCTINVTVNDPIPPEAVCTDITRRATTDCFDASTTLNSYTVSDNVPGVTSTSSVVTAHDDSCAAGLFPVSEVCTTEYEVTAVATDAAGNTATCTYTVTVLPALDDQVVTRDAALRQLYVVRDERFGDASEPAGFGANIILQTDIPYPFVLAAPTNDVNAVDETPGSTTTTVRSLNEVAIPQDDYIVCPTSEDIAIDAAHCATSDIRVDSCGQEFEALIEFESCNAAETTHTITLDVQCQDASLCDTSVTLKYDLQLTLRVDSDLCEIQRITDVDITATLAATDTTAFTDFITGNNPLTSTQQYEDGDDIVGVVTIGQSETGSTAVINGVTIVDAQKFYFQPDECGVFPPTAAECTGLDANGRPVYKLVETSAGVTTAVDGVSLLSGTVGNTNYASVRFSNEGEVEATERLPMKLEVTVQVDYGVGAGASRRLLTFSGTKSPEARNIRLAMKNLKEVTAQSATSVAKETEVLASFVTYGKSSPAGAAPAGKSSVSTGVLAGAGAGVVALIVVAIVATVVCMRRNAAAKAQQQGNRSNIAAASAVNEEAIEMTANPVVEVAAVAN